MSEESKYDPGFIQFTTQQGTRLFIRPEHVGGLSEVARNPTATGMSARTQIETPRNVFWVMEDIDTVLQMITATPELVTEHDDAYGDPAYWEEVAATAVRSAQGLEDELQSLALWWENWMPDNADGGRETLQRARKALETYRVQKSNTVRSLR